MLVPVPLGNGTIQSRKKGEESLERITVAGTGWIKDIRNYDRPMCETTTLLGKMRKKKTMGEPWSREKADTDSPLVGFRQCTT